MIPPFTPQLCSPLDLSYFDDAIALLPSVVDGAQAALPLDTAALIAQGYTKPPEIGGAAQAIQAPGLEQLHLMVVEDKK